MDLYTPLWIEFETDCFYLYNQVIFFLENKQKHLFHAKCYINVHSIYVSIRNLNLTEL